MNTSKSLKDILEEVFEVGYQQGLAGNTGAIKFRLNSSHYAVAIVEAVEGIYGDSDGLREFASIPTNQVVNPNVNKRKETTMNEFKHLDIEKVSARHLEEWLKTARLQGQWTATKSLQHQAELLGTEGPILEQFKVAIKRIEEQLPTPAASVVATTEGSDMVATDKEARNG